MLALTRSFIMLMVIWTVQAHAQSTIAFGNLSPIKGSFCQITLTGTATTLQSGCTKFPANANAALITVETASARWRDDGTAPTASVGQLLGSGSAVYYQGDLTQLNFIAVSGSPVLDINFYTTRPTG